MDYILEHKDLSNYLLTSKYVDFDKKIIQDKIQELFYSSIDEIEAVRIAFEYVRDEIPHSWDIQSERVTKTITQTLECNTNCIEMVNCNLPTSLY